MLKKLKNPIFIEILAVLVVICALGAYLTPKYLKNKDAGLAAKIMADDSAFTTKALEEFKKNEKALPSEIAQKITNELNETTVNPYNKKAPAYTFEKECKGCRSVEYDDNLTMIILTVYDKNGNLTARTVIKPPSFVTYNK